MPTELMAGAVPVLANAHPQPLDFRHQLFARHLAKVIVHATIVSANENASAAHGDQFARREELGVLHGEVGVKGRRKRGRFNDRKPSPPAGGDYRICRSRSSNNWLAA